MQQISVVEFIPRNPIEKKYYESLWVFASPIDGEIKGKAAVEFFSSSEVDKGVLKEVWNLSTGGRASMNMREFFTALRFITMAQNDVRPLSAGNLLYVFWTLSI